MVIVGLFAARSAALFARSAEQAQASQQVLTLLNEVMRQVTRAESEVRGYVVTGNPEFIKSFESVTLETKNDLALVRTLRAEPGFQAKIDEIEAAANARLAHSATTRRTYDAKGPQEAQAVIRSGKGLALMAELRSKIQAAAKDEEKLLAMHMKETAGQKSQAQIFLPFGIGISVFAMIVATRMVLRDSDKRFNAEARSRRLAVTQRAILDSTTLSVIAVDGSGKINLINKAGEAMLGYSAQELIGKNPEFVHDKEEIAKRAKELGVPAGLEVFTKPAFDHGVYEEDWTYIRKDGQKFPVQLSITPIIDESGQVHGYVGIASDLTERRSIMRQLDRYVGELEKTKENLAEKNALLEAAAEELRISRDEAISATNTKSEFLANMSHEIRTPLNGVLGTTHLLLGTELNDKQRSYVQLIHRSAESLLSILNDILDLSKMEAGKMSLEEAPFDLLETVEDVCEQFAPVAHQKQIDLNLLVPPTANTLLVGDSNRIRQVLTNLVANAIKFTERGEVSVTVSIMSDAKRSSRIRISVKDTGIGIAPDKLDAIFESFTQADGATARRFGGTGLGLAISRQLVELMNGEIGVGSKPSQGSEFWFELPLAKQEGATMIPRDLGAISVLIVDDNVTNRTILKDLLTSWNCRVEGAASAEEAAALLDRQTFDVGILDLQMPGRDGIQLARDIRGNSRTAELPLLLIASSHILPSEVESQGLFKEVLSKPVRTSLLYESVIKAIRGTSGRKFEGQNHGRETLQGVRILVVEDNPINQLVVTEMLKSWGCTVIAVDNGRKAVDRTMVDIFDMVLMDIQMPEMDGLEATQAIRKREKSTGRHLPIVAMTANAMKGDEQKCLDAGMDAYMCKPVQPKLLVEKIATAVGRTVRLEDLTKPAAEEKLPVFDPTQLEQTTSGKDSLQMQVLERYLANLEPQIARLREAVTQGNHEEVKSLAHSLKGGSWTVGALAIADLFRRLESDANSMSDEALERAIESAEGAMAAVRERIEGHMTTLASSSR
jgi:PAS domain S-box-containing protein